jgi:two-component system, cell cycle response regulator DivK
MTRVMVVDDNALNCSLARAILKRAGYEVVTAADAASAFEALEEGPVEVMVADAGKPRMDGREFCARLRADPRWTNIRIVAYTAMAMDFQVRELLAQGFDAVVVKPHTRAELLQAVKGIQT